MTELNRRELLKTAAAVGLAGVCTTKVSAASDPPKRKFTMDLSCGMIGVKADGREAIRLAHKYGFESVAPDTGLLARLSHEQLREVQANMKAKNLVCVGPPDCRPISVGTRRGSRSPQGFMTSPEKGTFHGMRGGLAYLFIRLTWHVNMVAIQRSNSGQLRWKVDTRGLHLQRSES